MATAVLLETVSIQKYVYASNRLVENIGASNIVTEIYQEPIKTAAEDALGRKVDIDTWRNAPEKVLINKCKVDFEVGYIGGGNALLFFKKHEIAERFVRNWTENLIVEAPGLKVAVAIEQEFKFDNFKAQLTELFKKLRRNKSEYLPQTFLPKHGITADCPYSGLTAEIYYQPPGEEEGKYISSVSNAKLSQARATLTKINDNYTLTTDIEKLGQVEGQDFIAIVHIDGNSLGEQFRQCKKLQELRQLSISMKEVMGEVYHEFIKFIISQMEYLDSEESGFLIQQNSDSKIILPFRPLLMEGDDITFITEGRLGVSFAKKYLELMSGKKLSDGIKEHELSAAAGVVITKTKYPFFRSYALAEELCQSAKEEARQEPDTSWLDFHIAYGGFSGTLKEIRQDKFTIKQGQLNFGPYLVSNTFDDEKSILNLENGIEHFTNIENWPRNDVKEFRTVLTLGQDATEHFLTQAEKRDKIAYRIKGNEYHKRGWVDGRTPYFDMIELMDFYPRYFLKK